MLLLGETVNTYDSPAVSIYSELIGAPDNLDICNASHWLEQSLAIDLSADGLKPMQKEALEEVRQAGAGLGKINDLEPSFRILSACQTPSAILFQKTADEKTRPLPSGLDVAVAMGSALAKKNIAAPDRDALLAQIEESADLFEGYVLFGPRRYYVSGRLYRAYLYALQALVDEPEPDAPDLMRTDAWQAKSLNALLASWAQMRHTWVLQAKQCECWLCFGPQPAGFVEPEPEFFARMADLARGTRILLDSQGAFDPDYSQNVADIRCFLRACGSLKTQDGLDDYFFSLSSDDQSRLLTGYELIDCAPSDNDWGTEEHYADSVVWLSQLAADIEAGHMDLYPEITRMLAQINGDLPKKWDELERICGRLESLAHKQLRGVAFSPEEEQFIAGYGETLGNLMFYDGNSYLQPRDDAPRVVDVYTFIDESGQRKNLEVGVARARELLVLYPWQGQTVLCCGAVMPYYEFTTPSRLDDAEWKSLLDSEKRPSVPSWFAPIVEGGELSAPEKEMR